MVVPISPVKQLLEGQWLGVLLRGGGGVVLFTVVGGEPALVAPAATL